MLVVKQKIMLPKYGFKHINSLKLGGYYWKTLKEDADLLIGLVTYDNSDEIKLSVTHEAYIDERAYEEEEEHYRDRVRKEVEFDKEYDLSDFIEPIAELITAGIITKGDEE